MRNWFHPLVAVVMLSTLAAEPAEAVIGRPLTPVSYAGVARRTTRRTVAATATAPVYAAPVVATAAVITTLPANCSQIAADGAVYYQCDTIRYEPTYSGSTLVYRQL